MPNAHDGYVSWAQFEQIQTAISENLLMVGAPRDRAVVHAAGPRGLEFGAIALLGSAECVLLAAGYRARTA
jgi:hypothetical protein